MDNNPSSQKQGAWGQPGSNGKGVLVCGELSNGSLSAISREMLAAGRKLADDLGEELALLLMGDELEKAAAEGIFAGADRMLLAKHPLLAEYSSDCYTAVVAGLCQKLQPSILLMGHTDLGRDLAPRLAARLGTGLCMDCVELAIDPDTRLLLQTRPVFGGNARAVKVCSQKRPQMATVRPKSVAPLGRDSLRQGQIVPVDTSMLSPALVRVQVVERVKEEATGVKLEDARVIVTGGRGIGGPQGFDLLRGLANLLGGAVGGSRAACEEGWLSTSLQVGQTGKIVSPDLYVAVAVSGAMQHLAGCSGARSIVAINKDPEANIFKVSRFGVVGDYRAVIPPLLEKCRELLKS